MVYATHKTQLHYQLNFSSTEVAFGLPCGSDDDDIHLTTHRDGFYIYFTYKTIIEMRTRVTFLWFKST